jgi:uncharacterized membrane protein
VVVDIFVSIAVAARQSQSSDGSEAAAFAAVWSMLILITIAVFGTLTLRRVRVAWLKCLIVTLPFIV